MIKANNYEAGTNDASFFALRGENVNKKKIYNYAKKNYYVIKTDNENKCPDCMQTMKIIGSRKRIVKDIIGEQYVFSLRRMKCEKCNVIHTEIPDCIIPHIMISKSVIRLMWENIQESYYINVTKTMEHSLIVR